MYSWNDDLLSELANICRAAVAQYEKDAEYGKQQADAAKGTPREVMFGRTATAFAQQAERATKLAEFFDGLPEVQSDERPPR